MNWESRAKSNELLLEAALIELERIVDGGKPCRRFISQCWKMHVDNVHVCDDSETNYHPQHSTGAQCLNLIN